MILGYDTIGATNGSVAAGAHYATKFTASEAGVISQISVYWEWAGTNMDFRVAIYSDSSGDPASKLAESASAATVTASGWYDIPIDYTFITNEVLWLVFMPASDQCSPKYDAGTTHQHDQHTGSYPTWNDPWGTPFGLDRMYSIYATYAIGGADKVGSMLAMFQ